jgi:peptidoglycan/LPS O-acetylase OafA/YrhL
MSTATRSEPVAVSASAARGQPHFYPQLDGVRGLAVLFVLMYHMEDLKLPASMEYLFSSGWIGVDAFFVLSGFLITRILLNTRPAPRSLGLFVLRRTLRTWPLYFAVLLIAYFTLRRGPSLYPVNWLHCVVFIQNYTPGFMPQTLGPTWSLCVEEHFYLVWPFVVFLVPRRWLFWILPAVFAALPAARFWGMLHPSAFTFKQLYQETQFHLDGLVAGSFVALLAARPGISPSRAAWAARACVVLGTGAAIIGFWKNWEAIKGHNLVFGFTSLAIAFAGLLQLLLRDESSLLIKAFSVTPLRYIGRISYGIYILQYGIISVLDRIPFHRILGSVAESWMFAIPLRVGVTIAIAALSYRFFESPILRIKERLR